MIGLESCFGVVNKIMCKDSEMNLTKLISLLTCGPRKFMGFESDLFVKGTPAEITIIDPEQDWIFSREHIKSRSINSPYIGKKMIGKVLHTISRSHIFKTQ